MKRKSDSGFCIDCSNCRRVYGWKAFWDKRFSRECTHYDMSRSMNPVTGEHRPYYCFDARHLGGTCFRFSVCLVLKKRSWWRSLFDLIIVPYSYWDRKVD